MFRRSFISVLIVTSAFTLVFGQTPEAAKEREKAATAFSWSFEGDGAYLGVQTQEISKDNFAKFGLREVRGVAVEKVMENSPAAAAGIQAGDVIVRFNGEEVTGTRKLTRLIGEVAPDHQVKVTVLRGGSEHEMTATLGKRPTPKFENGNFAFAMPAPMDKWEMPKLPAMPKGEMPQVFSVPGGDDNAFVWRAGAGRQIGVSGYRVTKQLGERFGVDGGVMINTVREDSPAAKAGLKAGDIIVEIDGKAVRGEFDLIRAINAKKEGDVTVTIVRDRNRQTISVTPEASKDGGFFFQTDDGDGPMPAPRPGQVFSPRPMVVPPAPMSMPAPMSVPQVMSVPSPMSVPSVMTLTRPPCII